MPPSGALDLIRMEMVARSMDQESESVNQEGFHKFPQQHEGLYTHCHKLREDFARVARNCTQ